jgi:hypothetical protein
MLPIRTHQKYKYTYITYDLFIAFIFSVFMVLRKSGLNRIKADPVTVV